MGRDTLRPPAGLAVAGVAWLVSVSALTAQSPLDVFGTHSGGARRPTVAGQEWYAFTALLLTELDGRFDDPNTSVPAGTAPTLRRHDSLQTSAGYNYLTYGRNLVLTYNAENWFPFLFLPRNTALTLAFSSHLGKTKDRFILRQAQDALHDFRGVTQNFRPTVQDGFLLIGADTEILFWPETKWLALGGHYSRASYHHEAGLTAVVVDRFGATKAYATVTHGWLFDAGVGPAPIAVAFGDRYWMYRASIEHSDRYGLAVAHSTGVFPGEREFLLSFYVAVQISPSAWLRGEFVNDMLGNKDRGFTGGGRLAFARTF